MLFYRAQIFQPAGREIVNDDNAFAVVEQALNQMRSNKSSPAGHKDVFHTLNG